MRLPSLMLSLALCAVAQSIPESEAARARHLLDSPQWREKAWGAYFAGRFPSDETNDRLIEAFREAAALRDAASYSEEHAFVFTLFDSAIQSGIIVPAELIEPFAANWRAAAIVLLARDPASDDALMRLNAGNLQDMEWLAVNNVLLARRSQRFFLKTLGELTISHTFTVVDPGDNSASAGGSGGGIFGDGVLVMPKGFPPVGVYNLVDYGLAGDIMLAHGPRDVYYRRFVVPGDKQIPHGVSYLSIDRQQIRIGDLASLGNLTEE
jgi:hypothetical protein